MWEVDRAGDGPVIRLPQTTITEFPLPTPNSRPEGIAHGNDGQMWFTERNVDKVASIYPDGLVYEHPVTAGAAPHAMASWGGALWFTEVQANAIGRFNVFGVDNLAERPVPTAGASVSGITAGPSDVWFTERDANKIGRIRESGSDARASLYDYPIPTANAQPSGICQGPDHNIWFTEEAAGKIARYVP